jgi:hypothetical protein
VSKQSKASHDPSLSKLPYNLSSKDSDYDRYKLRAGGKDTPQRIKKNSDGSPKSHVDDNGRATRVRACKKNVEYSGIHENDKYFEACINQGQEELAKERQIGHKTVYRDLQENLKYSAQMSQKTENPKYLTNGLSTLKYMDWHHTKPDTMMEEVDDMMLRTSEIDNILNYDEFIKSVPKDEKRPHLRFVNKERNLKILAFSIRKRIWKMSKTNGVVVRSKINEDIGTAALSQSVSDLQTKPSVYM